MRLGKFPTPTGDMRADSLRELRWAMSGEGLTPDKLQLMHSTLSLPAVQAALTDVPEGSRPLRAYEVICDAARALGGGLPARALRSALAIDYAGAARNLSDRRAELADHRDPHTLYYIEQRMLAALVTALGGLSGRPQQPPPAEPPSSGATSAAAPRIWGVPLQRDPHFVGRSDLLDTVRAELVQGRAAALTHTVTQTVSGLGGIGKTSLAAEYAFRFAAEYDVVWWVRSEDPTTLASDYAALHRALTGEVCEDQQRAITLVRDWLSAHGGWLLVFDNAEEVDDVTSYIPGLRGHVIVTSRNTDWTRLGIVVDVPPLDGPAATELVIRRTGSDDEQAAATLGRRLGGVPKVIEVASSLFVRGLCASLHEFIEQLGDGARATEGVWDAAFDRALTVPGAVDLLSACVVMNPDSLTLQLVEVAAGRTTDAIERAATSLRHTRSCSGRLVTCASTDSSSRRRKSGWETNACSRRRSERRSSCSRWTRNRPMTSPRSADCRPTRRMSRVRSAMPARRVGCSRGTRAACVATAITSLRSVPPNVRSRRRKRPASMRATASAFFR